MKNLLISIAGLMLLFNSVFADVIYIRFRTPIKCTITEFDKNFVYYTDDQGESSIRTNQIIKIEMDDGRILEYNSLFNKFVERRGPKNEKKKEIRIDKEDINFLAITLGIATTFLAIDCFLESSEIEKLENDLEAANIQSGSLAAKKKRKRLMGFGLILCSIGSVAFVFEVNK